MDSLHWSWTTFIGPIHKDNWEDWPEEEIADVNKFIWTTTLKPSRYALAYTAYVEVVFIPLDSENLSESNTDSFYYDFGDNMLPYFLGNSNNRLRKDKITDNNSLRDDQVSKDYEILKLCFPTLQLWLF